MKKLYLIPSLLLLIPIGVYAEQAGADCYDYTVSSGAGQICERVDKIIGQVTNLLKDQETIKQQNAQIISQQTHTNHLLEIQNCYSLYKNTYTGNSFSYSQYNGPDELIQKCGNYTGEIQNYTGVKQ